MLCYNSSRIKQHTRWFFSMCHITLADLLIDSLCSVLWRSETNSCIAFLFVFPSSHWFTYPPTHLSIFLPTYLSTYLPAYLPTYLPTYLSSAYKRTQSVCLTISQAVSRRLPTAKERTNPSAVYVQFVMDQVTMGQVILRELPFPCRHRSTSPPHTLICCTVPY